MASHRTFSYASGWNGFIAGDCFRRPPCHSISVGKTARIFLQRHPEINGIADTLQEGVGYWLKFDSARTIIIDGIATDVDSVGA